MENSVKVLWNAQILADYGQLDSDLLHGTVQFFTKFQADNWIPKLIEAEWRIYASVN